MDLFVCKLNGRRVCVDKGMEGSALPSAIIILVIFLLLLGIGKILIYVVIVGKIMFFCLSFC